MTKILFTMASASDSGIDSQSSPELTEEPPLSRTHQYRHLIKPMLERKRRARINKCLDELKDLMVAALQQDGESITKLEKADVLELTVRHLRKLKVQGRLGLGAAAPGGDPGEQHREGYAAAAADISRYVAAGGLGAGLEVAAARLLHHLATCVRSLEAGPGGVAPLLAAPPPAPALTEYLRHCP